jgi:hypothetical protein
MEQRHDILLGYLRYFIDLCVPWSDESSPWYERSAEGFCLLINAWNEKSTTFIEHQCFCFLSNFMTKGHQSSNNETAASAWRQQNADWWSEIKKNMTPIQQHTLKQQMVDQWTQMMKWLDN